MIYPVILGCITDPVSNQRTVFCLCLKFNIYIFILHKVYCLESPPAHLCNKYSLLDYRFKTLIAKGLWPCLLLGGGGPRGAQYVLVSGTRKGCFRFLRIHIFVFGLKQRFNELIQKWH